MAEIAWVERPTSSRSSRRGSQALAAAVLVTVTVLDYLVWLSWDKDRDVNPVTGAETGPYEPWQVVGVGAVLLLLAVVAGWHRHAVLAVVVVPTVFTTCWVIDAVTERTSDAGLWPIGAAILAMGCLLGTVIFAGVGVVTRALRHHAGSAQDSVEP